MSVGVAHACAESGIALTDQTGRQVRLAKPAARILSLAPNMTEMVYAVGATPIADTIYCDDPPAARSLPKVGGLDPDYETVLRLHPDLVLATTAGNRMESIDYLRGLGCAVYTSRPDSVAAILDAIRDVGRMTGREARAVEVAADIRRKIDAVAARRPSAPTRVLCLISTEPLITIGAGTYVHELIGLAGGVSVSAKLPGSWPVIDAESFLALAPGVILVAAPRDRLSIDTLPSRFRDLAGRTRIVFIDENLLMRPGPRIADAAVEVDRAIH